jgi:hypothetical protein
MDFERVNIGYAQVSTAEQNLTLQTDALSAVECERIFVETASGAQRDRPELKRALDYMRPGDTLVVWKLDRLARSMRQLIDTVEQSKGFCSLTEAISFGWTLTPKPAMISQATGWLWCFPPRHIIRYGVGADVSDREQGEGISV